MHMIPRTGSAIALSELALRMIMRRWSRLSRVLAAENPWKLRGAQMHIVAVRQKVATLICCKHG